MTHNDRKPKKPALAVVFEAVSALDRTRLEKAFALIFAAPKPIDHAGVPFNRQSKQEQ